ncbi:hypothetical protein CONSTELLA_225 [Mycobacterium phage Constella]|nr:hypothetical protein CONSTELLA_225 [Mycobacterium phage Constella]QBI98844.1 hypothetical protein SEA_BOBBY_214 [Mycobacterium phage Bobby]
MAHYGHGLYITPSMDGWQHGLRDLNGYRAEIVIYGDYVGGWAHYATYVLDYVTGITVVADEGCMRIEDIRARAMQIMRNGRRDGIRGTVVPSTMWN